MFSALIGQGIFRFVELIIGFFLGPVVLGYFKIAGKLFDVIVQFMLKPIVDVSFSAFSNIRDDKKKLEKCYLNFIKTCSIVAFPAFVGISVVGPEAVILFFGEKWAVSGNVLQILCIGGLSATLNWFFAPLCNATNNSKIPYKIRLFEFSLVISLVALCAQFSIYFVIAANVFVAALITVIMFVILSQKFSFSILNIIKQLTPSLISSLIMGIGVYLCSLFIPIAIHPILRLIILVCVGGGSYLAINLVLFPAHISDLLNQLKKLKERSV
jgi:O-antigen/teichoic acid export membrane protein